MLASLAAKGVAGREGARRLFIGMRNARLTDPQFSEADEAQYSDLHLAAIAWLAIQRMMAEAATEFGPARVRSVDSEQFIARPGETLTAVAAHFQMPLNVDARLASGVFDRHAKTGQQFSATIRANQIAESLRVHGAEIQPIVAWARVGPPQPTSRGIPLTP